MGALSDAAGGPIAALFDRGEQLGCVGLSEVDDLAQALELEEAELGALYEQLEQRGIDLRDDCGREAGGRAGRRHRARRRHHRHAAALPQRDRPPPAAHAAGGDRPRQAHRARRPRRQGAHDQREPAPGRVDRQEVPGHRADAARPHPGGHPRPDPRRREVRLAPRLPLLHLRDVVDPPGRRARDGRQGPHDQAADQPRAQPAQARARGEHAGGEARPAADRGRAGRRGRDVDPRPARAARRRPRGDVARPAARRGRGRGVRRPAALRGPGPEDIVSVSLREDAVRRAIGELPERERIVLAMRYGFEGGEPTPLREIGRKLGITPERVRQIESRALGRLGRMREVAALRQAAARSACDGAGVLATGRSGAPRVRRSAQRAAARRARVTRRRGQRPTAVGGAPYCGSAAGRAGSAAAADPGARAARSRGRRASR